MVDASYDVVSDNWCVRRWWVYAFAVVKMVSVTKVDSAKLASTVRSVDR